MNGKKKVSPKVLYPMTTIESIDSDTIRQVVNELQEGKSISPIRVIDFQGYYIILEGNYEMLASNIIGVQEVEICIMELQEKNNYLSEKDIMEQLRIVGMNALYDFEAIGGFKYLEYPDFYKGGK